MQTGQTQFRETLDTSVPELKIFLVAAFHTQRPGDYSICLSGQKFLAAIFVMKTNQVFWYEAIFNFT